MVVRAVVLAALIAGTAPAALGPTVASAAPGPVSAALPRGGAPRSLLRADLTGAAARTDVLVPAAANTYVVNSTGNGDDSSSADGVCNDGTGHCTLRAAITQADASSGSDEIDFSIGTGSQTIQVPGGVALPPLTDTITIDATTQPGYSSTTGHPVITIDGLGQGAAYTVSGLRLQGTADTVLGLDVIRFTQDGILATGAGAVVAGCYVGVDHTGLLDRGNLADGVDLGGNNGTVTATSAGVLNVISGNGFDGVATGGLTTGNVVAGALIGLTADGAGTQHNDDGVVLGGSDNTLGAPTETTVISGNFESGVDVQYTNDTVQDVLVGTNAFGSARLPNGIGVQFEPDAAGSSLTASLVSGNAGSGVVTAAGTNVYYNFIGTDLAGTAAIGNGTGVSAQGSGFNASVYSNVISGNDIGVEDGTGSDSVQLNLIGTDVGGTNALPNGVGAYLYGSGENHFDNNVVAHNTADGVQLGGDSHHVDGNTITDNGGAGIVVNGDGFAFIGTDQGNTISSNGGAGVAVVSGQNTTIAANSIHDNGGLGIDLGADGVTPNDTGDADTGPNGLQNFPVLTSAHVSFRSTTVKGTLNSAASTTYRLDFYASPSCDSPGNGEGATWLGTTTAVTDGAGDLSFTYVSRTLTPPRTVITATATDPDGSTSELSGCRTVTGANADLKIGLDQESSTVAPGDPAFYRITVTNAGPAISSGVVVTDTLSTAATFSSVTPSQGTCSAPTTVRVTCSLGAMARNASASVQIVVEYPHSGPARHTARASSLTYDPNLADDTATIRTRVA
jgi:uncharacterized repeat protein (TIGR01451 family)